MEIKVGNETIRSSTNEKLLGMKINNKLTFKTNVEVLCKKAGRTMHELA